MPNTSIASIRKKIAEHKSNAWARKIGYVPVFTAHPSARIMLIGQAPGIRAQESETPWDDKSGERLREWLDISGDVFCDPTQIALMPMDFYYPGKGKTGDLPPRKDFASRWHPELLDAMPDVMLTLLVGQYAQKHYLDTASQLTLTETVKNHKNYAPEYFPLPHPSPRNNIWMKKNDWFETDVLPYLKKAVHKALA